MGETKWFPPHAVVLLLLSVWHMYIPWYTYLYYDTVVVPPHPVVCSMPVWKYRGIWYEYVREPSVYVVPSVAPTLVAHGTNIGGLLWHQHWWLVLASKASCGLFPSLLIVYIHREYVERTYILGLVHAYFSFSLSTFLFRCCEFESDAPAVTSFDTRCRLYQQPAAS